MRSAAEIRRDRCPSPCPNSPDLKVKNDHIGFEILYVYNGVVRKYRPDFLVRLANGDTLVLETKGQDTEQDRAKRRYLDEWTRAVNAHGGFGRWKWAVAKTPGEIRDILLQHRQAQTDT